MDTFSIVFILQVFLSTSMGSLLPCSGEGCRPDVVEFPIKKHQSYTIYTIKNGRLYKDEVPGVVAPPVQPEPEGVRGEVVEAPSYFDFSENVNLPEVLPNPEPEVVQVFGTENFSEERNRKKDYSRFRPTNRKPEETPYWPLGPIIRRFNSSKDQISTKKMYSPYRLYTTNRGVDTSSVPLTTTKRQYGTTEGPHIPKEEPFTTTKRHYEDFHIPKEGPYTTTKRHYGDLYNPIERPYTTTERHYGTFYNPKEEPFFTTTKRHHGDFYTPSTTTKRHENFNNPKEEPFFTTTKRHYGTFHNPNEGPVTTTERHPGTPDYPYFPTERPFTTTKRSFSTFRGPFSTKGSTLITTKGFHTTTKRPYGSYNGPYKFFTASYKVTARPLDETNNIFGISYERDNQRNDHFNRVSGSTYGKGLDTSSRPKTDGFLRGSAMPLDTLERSADSDIIPPVMMAGDLNALLYMTQFNLSGFNFTGAEVKYFLHRVNTTEPLRRLLLSHNNISALLRETFPIQLEYSLQELNLDSNPLVSLSRQSCFELSRLKSLRVLSLSRTNLKYIEGIFYLPGLEVLDLSDNDLTMVPPGIHSLSQLRLLDLSGNDMVWLDSYPLYTLRNLRVLNLAENGMKYIREDPFSTLDQLESLFLNNNSLEFMTGLSSVPESAWVYLSGNPWMCQCDFLSMVFNEWPYVADKNLITCIENGKEGAPHLLSSLTEEEFSDLCPRGRAWVRRRAAALWAKIGRRLSTLWEWVKEEAEWLRRHVVTDNLFTLLQILFLLYFLLQVYNVLLVVRNVKSESDQGGDSRYTKVADVESVNGFRSRRHSC